MEQHLMSNGRLLNEKGNIDEPGYAFSMVKEYSRKDIKAKGIKIKEWDYYYSGDDNFGICLTIDDNSYMGMASISIIDYQKGTEITTSKMKWFTFGKTNLPSSTKDGDLFTKGKGYEMKFYNKNGDRHLVCRMEKFDGLKTFTCDIKLTETTPYSMVIATPFDKDKHFYYNQKINLLKAVGSFSIGDFSYTLSPTALGVLDWGRGVWTYKNTWYWSSLNCHYNGHNIGFNLGYGFGNTSAATENMLFVDDKVYKLDDVTFNIPKKPNGKDDFLKPWDFTSKNGDINLKFVPIVDRCSDTNVLVIRSNQHQVFGRFTGTITVNGQPVYIENQVGFAEKVYNKW